MFADVSLNSDLNENDLMKILKKLYETGFFEDISLSINQEILKISVAENPVIEKIDFQGLKSNKILEVLK